jgi:hypothetical protein
MKKVYESYDQFHAAIYSIAGKHKQLGVVTMYKTSVFFGTEFVADYSYNKDTGQVNATFTPKYAPEEEVIHIGHDVYPRTYQVV